MQIEALTASKIAKHFGYQRALGDVDLTVRAGELCALLGANGAGKSTLIGILSTLIRPSAGKVAYRAHGRLLHGGAELRREIGLLAHSSFVYAELTGWENLILYGRLYGLGEAEGRASQLLDGVGIDERVRHRRARTYSRGMMQRLALARALVHEPQILLLDEPFTGLDRGAAAALAARLAAARREGRIILVVTHDLEAIAGLADRVVVLRRGKVSLDQSAAHPMSYEELKDIYQQHAG